MELVSARRSRTVLTAANGGDIIAAVRREPLRSRGVTQEMMSFQPRVLEILCDSNLHENNLTI